MSDSETDSDFKTDSEYSESDSEIDSDEEEPPLTRDMLRAERPTHATVQTEGPAMSEAQTQTAAPSVSLGPDDTEEDMSRALSEYVAVKSPEAVVSFIDFLANVKKKLGPIYEKAKREVALREFLQRHEEFACPILGTLMRDPVVAVPYDYGEGQTYERSAIREHIDTKKRANFEALDPLSNKRIRPEVLANVALRNTIERALKKECVPT